MTKLSTTSVSFAVTPTVVATLFSHYLNREPLREKPTAHLSYDEGLRLVRAFLQHAAHHTVEDLQAFTSQWVPSPQWVKLENIKIPEQHLSRSAELINEELGEDGRALVGGSQWWQWRRPKKPLEAEWIEMRGHANERKRTGDPGHRVILYFHGGGYYFGSVDEHRYQMQRHARKLKARVLAPRYRLAPQFPFPCGLQDCLAAYLHLLSSQDPSTIILAGDSAGGGMALALLLILRNQDLPLPAGAILISPWVDLTHSFKSIAGDAPMDYIPANGFHHRPSKAWPPPNDDDITDIKRDAQQMKRVRTGATESRDAKAAATLEFEHKPDERQYITLDIDGKPVTIKDQIQLYTTNALLTHPLVSPVLQATLGGLPPLLVMVGGGEILRDEQIYLAHKAANPQKHAPQMEGLSAREKEQLAKFKPTDVQLQVWEDLCHVAPTLSFTKPAKFMYRSIAQFGAWLLARAQHRGIEIMDDDRISVISSSGSDAQTGDIAGKEQDNRNEEEKTATTASGQVGKAGDPLPPFKNHMIRQRVTRHGVTLPLAPEEELEACTMDPAEVGVFKAGTAKKWLATRREYDTRYAGAKAKVHKQLVSDLATGFQDFGPGELPPPAALAGRRKLESHMVETKKKRSFGLSLWSLWGSKHDEETIEREQQADEEPEAEVVKEDAGGRISHREKNGELQTPAQSPGDVTSRSRSRRRTVVDEHQTQDGAVDEDTPVAQLLHQRQEQEASHPGLLSPDYVPETGVAGKRPFIKGLALPFSLNKEADTASMVTLTSHASPGKEANRQLAILAYGTGEGDGDALKPETATSKSPALSVENGTAA
ncbi:alpha/beta hydrolase fold-3 [Cordyceps fumosorosea ARSEF 2679]|uniref:Alpha/beta hydrolase fold-3 n=1 Tax=Cordyceps fumosorosea (strain ARSEF 2679) TaxID=1081104 RepID=A0A168BKV1_CORFA|nr:alpha/beta hydrolase fold-3 [Cordyceps fumosorosea ARSEF 2679]OAA70245.1 alpha/beta hydrolase fold-3 [Cordyceps fumosorosea ARSEF 2679]